jgi:hypothetical protein
MNKVKEIEGKGRNQRIEELKKKIITHYKSWDRLMDELYELSESEGEKLMDYINSPEFE